MLLIDSRIVPEIYLKVIETKKLIALGIAKNASEAVKITGISRSAYYKYRDYVSEYNNSLGKIITFQGVLSDTPGVLSGVLTHLYKFGANILTVNQDLPTGGRASFTVTVSCENVDDNINLYNKICKLDDVITLSQVIG